MHRRDFVISTLAGFAGVFQKKTIEPEFAALKVVNRTLSRVNEGARDVIRLSENSGDGFAYFSGIEFTNGLLEFDVRGKDVQQQSFVGVAFHGLDEKTYDAVYFRPFNFKADDPVRRAHAVQYIAHPVYTWEKLRMEQPGKYEQPVNPVPNPNDWFHARIIVASPKVSVYVNGANQPSLTVSQLSNRNKGWVGFWVGNTSGGDFANFKIIPS
jgi:3-keto-disaccharide hydrolase